MNPVEERRHGPRLRGTQAAQAPLVNRPYRKQKKKTQERRPPGYQPSLEELYADLKKLIERSRASYLRRRDRGDDT